MGATVAVNIRPMTLADIEKVLQLEAACFAEPWPRAMFVDELARPDRRYLVTAGEADVIAYGGLMVVGDSGHIMTLAVHPDHRRLGYGLRLLLRLVDTAGEAGVEHLTLEVRESNEAARRLYQAFGFHEVGVRPGYYRNEDAVIMWAVDIGAPEYRKRLARLRGRQR